MTPAPTSERTPERLAAAGMQTAELARVSGYSVQQVRDLERLGVIPAADRAPNGYRVFAEHHVRALRVYRQLAVAVGPVAARGTLRDLGGLPPADAAARISSLHVGLVKERDDALAAQRALLTIQAEAAGTRSDTDSDDTDDDDSMTITQLADALGVRPSTLRFWEEEGLVRPDRIGPLAARRYPSAAIREARITAALRAAGYRIPAVRRTIDATRALDDLDDLDNPLAALSDRLTAIAGRIMALLEAGTDLARMIAANRW